MSTENKLTLEDVTKQLSELEATQKDIIKRAETAEKIVAMPLNERMVFDELSKEDKDKYLAGDETIKKSVQEKISKSSDDDEDGEPEIPEAVAKRFDDIKKRLDESQEQLRKAEELAKSEKAARELVECSKRAEKEFPNLPGTAEEKGAILKMLKDKLSTDEVTKVETLLKAGDAALATVTTEVGKSGSGAVITSKVGGSGKEDPATKLEKLANEKVEKSDGKLTFGKAYDQVLKTPEGKKLYDEYVGQSK